MRLIDADELRKLCDAPHWCVWLSEIDDFPSVEAVVLPCKLGDPVYMIRECSCHCADEHRKSKRRKCSEKVYLGQKLRAYHCGYVTEAKFDLKHLADFGKKVFLTREEAEAALVERKNNDEKDVCCSV